MGGVAGKGRAKPCVTVRYRKLVEVSPGERGTLPCALIHFFTQGILQRANQLSAASRNECICVSTLIARTMRRDLEREWAGVGREVREEEIDIHLCREREGPQRERETQRGEGWNGERE